MGVVAAATVGTVTTPLAQVACVTAGATGCSGVHAMAGNATVNVAVVAFTFDHPVGNVAGHATPDAANVAVTVTFWAGDGGYVPAGLPAGLSV